MKLLESFELVSLSLNFLPESADLRIVASEALRAEGVGVDDPTELLDFCSEFVAALLHASDLLF